MGWALVFLIYTAHGNVHRNVLHGYGSHGDCQLDAKAFERRIDLIKWECVRDEAGPIVTLAPSIDSK